MIRDFSDRAKQELTAMISQIENEKLCDFTDWIGDRWYDFEEWIGVLHLEEDLSNVNSYHRKVIDKNNMTLQQLESIFSKVYSVESEYHKELTNIITTCRAFNRVLQALNDVIMPKGGSAPLEGVHTMLGGPFKEYMDLFHTYINWEERLRRLLEQHRAQENVTDEDKDEYIRLYERYNVELRDKLDNLLEKLTEEQIREVKYILYTSEEPYRSIYLRNLESYTIGNVSGEDTGYFTTSNNTINVDMVQEPENPRGPYTTFFHESGHAIDYNFYDDGDYYTHTYRNADGQSLQDVIYEDVRNDIRKTISDYTSDKTMQDNLLDYIMGAGSVNEDTLSRTEKKLLENIRQHYREDMAGAENEACSDVYGGVTNNIIRGDYGHNGEYYWYDRNGNATRAQSRELWAEYYSYCMTGNEEAMENLREHFPNAAKFLDEMAESMGA